MKNEGLTRRGFLSLGAISAAALAGTGLAGCAQPKPASERVDKIETINCSGINAKAEICGVTTTSGLAWKIPGRVGDSPILGAGLYVDDGVGALALVEVGAPGEQGGDAARGQAQRAHRAAVAGDDRGGEAGELAQRHLGHDLAEVGGGGRPAGAEHERHVDAVHPQTLLQGVGGLLGQGVGVRQLRHLAEHSGATVLTLRRPPWCMEECRA